MQQIVSLEPIHAIEGLVLLKFSVLVDDCFNLIQRARLWNDA